MGYWDIGPFHNDDAGDWIDELAATEHGDRNSFLLETLVTADSDPDLDECARVIAAAATVAYLIDPESQTDDGYLPPLDVLTGISVDRKIRDRAIDSISRVLQAGSAWSLVFRQSGLLREVKEVLSDTIRVLQSGID